MRKIIILPLLAAMLTVTACGEKQIAKNTVKEFLKAGIAGPDNSKDYSIGSFGELDSTKYVTEDIINRMHANADKDTNFTYKLLYWKPNPKEQLKYMTVKVTVEKVDTTYTFYLTNDMKKVVAFK